VQDLLKKGRKKKGPDRTGAKGGKGKRINGKETALSGGRSVVRQKKGRKAGRIHVALTTKKKPAKKLVRLGRDKTERTDPRKERGKERLGHGRL